MTLNPQDELLDRARKVIRELREKLSAAEARSHSEPVAVIGMGFRFPGCGSDPDQFWRMIVEGCDAVQSIPPDRWDADAFYSRDVGVPGKINTRHAAFLNDVRRFDAAFFDITPREAVRMDPQQRIFLETAWHALEDAGISKRSVSGSDTGVFVGVHSHSADYHALQFADIATLDPYASTGTAHDMIAGRLAYWLDLHGPAVVMNTACSSSLTAVHVACRSLRAGDCSMAIVGGVNLLLTPGSTTGVAQLQLLSPDGRCKAFDARADGMGRGEGCGVVVLKPLSAAQRDGDRVQAIIRGSAVNQDGKTNGLTAPNGLAQRRVLMRALEDAGVNGWEIGYVEAHGTGTALGDPIEVEALADVLGGARRSTPCVLGAVKANIGHLEGAAGIAGLIKAALVLQRRWLPPVAKLDQLNPHLALEGTGLTIPQHGCEWRSTNRRLAGVSSFGWSGTNAHVVMEEPSTSRVAASVCDAWPVVVSAHSLDALRIVARAYADRLERADKSELADISYTSTTRRTHHPYRIAVKGTDAKEIASQLRKRVADSASVEASHSLHGSPNGGQSKHDPANLNELTNSWEAGADVDWSTAFLSPGNVVDLPRYPFQGRPYWLESAATPVTANDSFPGNWIYSTLWVDKPFDYPVGDLRGQSKIWLLFREGDEFSARLAEAIRQRGDRVISVQLGDRFSRESNDDVSIGRHIASDLKQLFAELSREGKHPHYAVYTAGDEDAAEMTAQVLEITQAITRSDLLLKLWFITQGAACQAHPCDPHHSQAAMRGFSRTFGLEHPALAGGVIDVDSPSFHNADAVCEEIAQSVGEDRVLLKEGRRWVARLRREVVTDVRLELKSDRCYLVTGAFGKLGMAIASWLVNHGARHLALLGRRDPTQLDSPGLLRQLQTWRAQGIAVIAEACDVSNELQVRDMIARMEAAGSPVAGVIHAAAGYNFKPILEATPQDVNLAFLAKVEGARLLDRCTREGQLDFFVLFSSAAATVGLRDGALYAAANSSLDAIAGERQALGLPVLCVEWGAWEHQRDDAQRKLIESSGFRAMPTKRALQALGALIASGKTSSLVADIDWDVLGPALEIRGKHALVAEIFGDPSPKPMTPNIPADAEWLNSLHPLALDQRRRRLLDFVGKGARKIFGMTPEDPLDENRGLFQLGMDSLMSVRLKRRLESGTGLKLPGTLTLTYPTIAALAEYLDGKLFPPAVSQIKAASSPLARKQEEAMSTLVAEMNESETNAAIAAELAAIHLKLGVL
jgi:acyl transferase domain-containing protein/acyl carrier protein